MSGTGNSEQNVQDKYLKVKQNNGTNDIARSFNRLQKIKEVEPDQWGDKKIPSPTGNYMVKPKEGELKRLEQKLESNLKSPNAKKLFLYFCHRVAVKNKTRFTLNLDEFLEDLRGDKNRWRTVHRLIQDLNLLEQVKIHKFRCIINGEESYYEDDFLLKAVVARTEGGEDRKGRIKYITIIGGAWSKSLIETAQYAYIPKELFKLDKLELDLGYNILIRCRIELKYMTEQKRKYFTLPISRLIEGANLPNPRSKGSNYVIDKIEEVLNKLQSLDWFIWEYDGKTRDDLPGQNILSNYKNLKIKFEITGKELAKIYKLE